MAESRRLFSFQRGDGSNFSVAYQRNEFGHEDYKIYEGPQEQARIDKAANNYARGLTSDPSALKDLSPDHFKLELEELFKSVGAGSFQKVLSTFMTGFNRAKVNYATPPLRHVGYTFITRPCLPLVSINLRQDPTFFSLDTMNPSSLGFAIRCILDTKFAKSARAGSTLLSTKCPLYNHFSAFNQPLGNALSSISGWPDYAAEVYTSPEGFFGENQSVASTPDWLNGSYDLSLTFQDVEFSPILHMLCYWFRCIQHLVQGSMVAYPESIDDQEIPYTVSIYRFVMDTTRKFITDSSRAVGCFPGRTVPIGDLFNYNANEVFSTAGHQITVPFVANAVRYNDPNTFIDFNTVVQRYAPNIANWPEVPDGSYHNYEGIPFIDIGRGGEPMLTFRVPSLS